MATSARRWRVPTDYKIACICPMGVELAPVEAMLDEIHDDLPTHRDQNAYTLGRIGGHDVVITIMPEIGNNTAATVAIQLQNDFPSIRFGLLVGIGGGVPGDADVRLGDVVVSQATGTSGGVVQYDLGKRAGDGTFKRTGQLNKPPSVLSSYVRKLQSQHRRQGHRLSELVSDMLEKNRGMSLEYARPTTEDRLFLKTYVHSQDGSCAGCDVDQTVKRSSRPSTQPYVHYGTIGSANTVLKDALLRDELREDMNLLCVEMEAAGIMNDFPCLVIRGICDYADSHKNKEWQPYAAAVAAAYMRELLQIIPTTQVSQSHSTAETAQQGSFSISDPNNVYSELPIMQRARELSARGQLPQPMQYILPRSRQRGARHEYEAPEYLESGHRLSEQPNRYPFDDCRDDPMEMYDGRYQKSESGVSLEDYLQSLKFEQMNDRRRGVDDNAMGTCEWLLTSDEYTEWIRDKGFFLIRGTPGCGKSTLINYALTQQREHTAREKAKALNISFFFDGGEPELRSMHAMLRSLLWQLVREDEELRTQFYELCHDIFSARMNEKNNLNWDMRDLQKVLARLLDGSNVRHDVRIFVDAIDECRNEDQDDAISFLCSLVKLDQTRSRNMGILMTGQTRATMQVRSDFTIQLEKRNQHDIWTFLNNRLRLDDDTREDEDNLRSLLQNQAQGSFIWLVLVIRIVQKSSKKGDNMPVIMSKVSQCPQGLYEFYGKLVAEIDVSESVKINALFQWMCFAARSLSVEELRIALTVHTGEGLSSMGQYTHKDNLSYIPTGRKLRTRVTYLSVGLVDFSSTDPADDDALARFCHESIKDFMLEKGLGMIQSMTQYACDLVKTASAQLTNTCLRFLSAKEINEAMTSKDMEYLSRSPFFNYARDHWHEHAMETEKNGTADLVDWTLHPALSAWICINQHSHQDIRRDVIDGTQPLHVAARYGLVGLVSTLLDTTRTNRKPTDQSVAELNAIDSRDTKGATALMLAASEGHLAVVRLLHEQGGDIRLQDKDGQSSLYSASLYGHLKVATYLFEHGASADIHTPNNDGFTPLCAASYEGRLEVAKYLLEHGANADIHTPNNDGMTPLWAASYNGHIGLVRYLIGHGADADLHTPSKYGWTPLYAASYYSHIEVVKCLLEHGADADIHTPNNDGWTPLCTVSSRGQLEVAKYLLKYGADIHAPNNDSWTPLYTASYNGHLEVVKYLLEHGADADIHTPNKDGWTPLCAVSSRGHLEVVRYLLKQGANVRTPDNNRWTPLCAASCNGHLEVVKYLIEHGADADIHTPNNNGCTPLYMACFYGRLDVTKYLLEHGADTDIHTPNNDGLTPLCAASYSGHLEIVRHLIGHGADADLHTPSKSGWTPLYAASYYGHIEVIQCLLEHGADADIHTPNNDGSTPLYTASCLGHFEVVKCLLKHGADADTHTPDNNGWTPLCAASSKGHLEVVRYLVEHGADADIHTPNNDGSTPLYTALCNSHLEVVKYLLKHGADADIHTPNKDGWTPLYAASYHNHLEVVKCLLQHGADADTDIPDNNGWTPLCTVSSKGYLEVAKYLLKHGANVHTPDNNGWTPLCAASSNGHIEVVRYLLDHGAHPDIHTPNKHGWTPFYAALCYSHIEVVKCLLEHGANADIHTPNNDGWTPLYAASCYGHLELVRYLLEHGAGVDVHIPTVYGETPLHIASRQGHLKVTQLLLEAGANVNVRGPHEQTSLIYSIVFAQKEISRLLIRFSADVALMDSFGRTASDWLKLFKTDAELLGSACSDPGTPPNTDEEQVNKSIASISATILDRQLESSTNLFNQLGQYFLILNDIKHACVAFRQKVTITSDETSIQHDVCCDLCSEFPVKGSRFVCKICPDTDLCKSCMEEYRKGKSFAACNMHEYLELSGSEPTPMNNDSLRTWLQDMVDRYTPSP